MENTNLFTQSQNKYSQLALDTYQALIDYISPYHWGIEKAHVITKGEWIAYSNWKAARNNGVAKPKIPICNEDGSPWVYNFGPKEGQPVYFNWYLNFKSKVWTPEQIEPCLSGVGLHYYMSPARAGKKLGYLDLDVHNEWQDDLPEAIELAKSLFGNVPFWRFSQRGFNGWLKFANAPAADKYNAGMAKAEQVLSDVFASERIKTSIEVKGRSVWGKVQSKTDRRSHLAKLPYWNHRFPCYQKDENDKWRHDRLQEFKALPDIDFRSFMREIEILENKLQPSKVAEGKSYLKKIEQEHCQTNQVEKESLQTASVFTVASVAAPIVLPDESSEKEAFDIQLPQSLRSCTPPARLMDVSFGAYGTDDLEDIRNITDAFVRGREFAFWCNRKAKRPLTAVELLELDRKHNIYNGTWQGGLERRKKRYTDIARFAADTFDQSKCGDKSQRPKLDENLKEWRAKAHLFPKVAIGYCGSKDNLKEVKVNSQTLISLAAIIQTSSKPDTKDCPRDTIEGWWRELAAEGILPKWHTDTYTAARSVLVRYKLICVDHDCYWWSPDRRGQSKRIWIRATKQVGEANYTYPSTTVTPLSPLHYRYNQKVIENEARSALEMTGKPPP